MGNNFFPVLFSRRADRRGHQPKSAAFVVGADQKLVAVMVRIILNVLLARSYQLPLAFGIDASRNRASEVVWLPIWRKMIFVAA